MTIETVKIKTAEGHILQMFYNHDSKLLVIDLVAASEKGGNELLRKTLDFRILLKHAK